MNIEYWSFAAGLLSGGFVGLCLALLGVWLLRGQKQSRNQAQNQVRDVGGGVSQVQPQARVGEKVGEQEQRLFLVGKLTAGIAHDFNNILTAMLGHVDALIVQAQRDGTSLAELMQIKKSGLRAAHLIRQLLSFSRQQTVKPATFDAVNQVQETMTLLERLVGEDVDVSLIADPEGLWVHMDAGQFEQVVLNLVVNARDAMKAGGSIKVTAHQKVYSKDWMCRGKALSAGPYVCLQVADTGDGIAPDVLPHIFDPYYTTKSVGQGTGLGLATVDGIAQQAGGLVHAYNNPSGEAVFGGGAVFEVLLPLTEKPENDATPHVGSALADTPEEVGVSSENHLRILVVEDDAAVRFVLVQTLKRVGHHVVEAHHGGAALELLDQDIEGFDLLVSDIVMPGMDGPEMVSKIRNKRPDLRVIYVSGYAEARERDRVADDHKAAFLAKPFTSSDLVNLVNRLPE